MDIKIIINIDNDAFTGESELARILQTAADKFQAGQTDFSLFDINGNCVGSFETIED